ncbi:hypothetical protein UlMin_041082 [Ulmus minor]
MDNLFKQTRLRISGFGKENVGESGSSKDRTIPPQKSVSFKEKKKGQNWFRRQFSRQMSQDYDSNNGEIEHSVAIAAAAFAITSLDESSTPAKKLPKEDPSSSAITIKGKREETDPGRVSKKSSESKVPVTAATDTKPPEKVLLPAPSFRKTSSVVDKQKTGSFKPESASPKPDKQKGSRPPPPPPPPLPPPLPRTATKRESSTRPGMAKTQADIWEEAQMAKIKESHERQKVTINSWEEKKKTKAKRRLENKERELESKRAKAMEKFRRQIRYIDQVAGGARAKAEENQRNEVLKAKEKANAYRRTGKFPKSCFCF